MFWGNLVSINTAWDKFAWTSKNYQRIDLSSNIVVPVAESSKLEQCLVIFRMTQFLHERAALFTSNNW